MSPSEIQRRIEEHVPGAVAEVRDYTGTGDHFEVRVVAAAFEGKDITAPLKTSMRAYELPDWQFIKIETQLESQ